MGHTLEAEGLREPGRLKAERATGWLLTVSGVFLAAQVAATRYGPDEASTPAFWFVAGCSLLALVYWRRSRAARGLVIVTSLAGAVIYGLGALIDGRSAFLALAYLGQAAPLMLGPVRRHVQSGSRGPTQGRSPWHSQRRERTVPEPPVRA